MKQEVKLFLLKITAVVIRFNETFQGEKRRKGDIKLQIKYPGCTAIE